MATWVKASDRLPEIVERKAFPRFCKYMKKRWKGEPYEAKAVAYYFPDRFKTIDWEDWDEYNEKDFPYTENDGEAGIVWLRAGWYSSVECDKCEGYWSAPLDVIEWLDETPVSIPEDVLDNIAEYIGKYRNDESMTNHRIGEAIIKKLAGHSYALESIKQGEEVEQDRHCNVWKIRNPESAHDGKWCYAYRDKDGLNQHEYPFDTKELAQEHYKERFFSTKTIPLSILDQLEAANPWTGYERNVTPHQKVLNGQKRGYEKAVSKLRELLQSHPPSPVPVDMVAQRFAEWVSWNFKRITGTQSLFISTFGNDKTQRQTVHIWQAFLESDTYKEILSTQTDKEETK